MGPRGGADTEEGIGVRAGGPRGRPRHTDNGRDSLGGRIDGVVCSSAGGSAHNKRQSLATVPIYLTPGRITIYTSWA